MSQSLRHCALTALLVTVASGLAGCSGGSAGPPPVALAGAAADTCFERQTGPDTWEVGCAGPAGSAGGASAGQAGARAALFDRVLRRSAQLAEQEGFPAFRVGETRINAITVVRHDYGDPSWGPGGPPHWGPISQAEHWRDYRHLHTAVTTTAPRLIGEIRLVRTPVRGDYIAAEIIASAAQRQAAPSGVPSAR
jgi:hypothetical protein